MRTLLSVVVAALFAGACNVHAQEAPEAFTAAAAPVSNNLTILVYAPFKFTFSPPAPLLACNAAAGTLVATMVPSAGDGNPASYAISGDTTDFALSGSTVVVGPNGIAPANCPVPPALTTTLIVGVAGTQP